MLEASGATPKMAMSSSRSFHCVPPKMRYTAAYAHACTKEECAVGGGWVMHVFG